MTRSRIRGFVHRATAARVLILFAFHAVVFASCYAFAWLLRFEFQIPGMFIQTFKWSLPIVTLTQLIVGGFFGFYRGWWRYVGIADVMRVVYGLTFTLALLLAGWYAGGLFGIDPRFIRSPRGVLLIDWAFSLLTLFGARVLMRVSRDHLRPSESASAAKRVLIIGAGDAGETLAREVEHRPQLGMKIVGFIDDQRAKWGSQIRGINVFGPISEIGSIADSLEAQEALIAIPSAPGTRLREIIHHLMAADLRFKTIPGIDRLVSGSTQVTQLRPVNVEDLLRRKPIELPGDPVRAMFRGKRVLVTGAGGTIGSELAVQIAYFEPARLALVERCEFALYDVRKRLSREAGWVTSQISSHLLDVADAQLLEDLLKRERPEIVLHAAAHKHVPLGEENPAEYLRNNTLAARSIAELSAAYGTSRFVFISTDKAINPSSIMGASKRAAEIALLDAARAGSMKVTVVRFGNVIGSSGSVIPLFMEQIAAGGPVTVTHPDVTRYFLRTSEAVSLVLQAATLGDAGQIFMLDMGEPVKILELAHDLIRLSNHEEGEVSIVFVGLRPGEKLFEEIRLHGESIRPTIHPQIVITEAPQPAPEVVARWLATAKSDHNMTAERAVAHLQALVAEYQPLRPDDPLPQSEFVVAGALPEPVS